MSNTQTLKHSNTQTLKHSNTQTLKHSNTQMPTPKHQCPNTYNASQRSNTKDAPLSEDSNPAGVEDDVKASSLVQMQNVITYLSEVVSQQQQTLQSTLVAQPALVTQTTTIVTHVFTGPLNDVSTVLHHADHLHNLLHGYSLLMPLDYPQQEENRHVSILEAANNSVDCAGLLAWVDNISQMMETDGESNWDEWVAAFKV
ncbi:hypothetical protein D1P53_004957 [Cryptococcus gattii VGV]|nr:hypothetical protein D1P53_004957 [Cryptococcus gattii VGV]